MNVFGKPVCSISNVTIQSLVGDVSFAGPSYPRCLTKNIYDAICVNISEELPMWYKEFCLCDKCQCWHNNYWKCFHILLSISFNIFPTMNGTRILITCLWPVFAWFTYLVCRIMQKIKIFSGWYFMYYNKAVSIPSRTIRNVLHVILGNTWSYTKVLICLPPADTIITCLVSIPQPQVFQNLALEK